MELSINDFPEGLKLLKGINKSELDHLRVGKYAPKDSLILEGTSSEKVLYLILEGICIGEKKSKYDSKQLIYRMYPKNQFIGLQEIIAPQNVQRVITIYARTEVYALSIEGKDLLRWQIQYPETYNAIISHILDFQFQNHTLLMHCIFYNTNTSLIYYLCTLYDMYHYSCYAPTYAQNVKIYESREEISKYLARDVRTINRLLNKLKSQNLISILRGKININQSQYVQLTKLLEGTDCY